MFKNMSYNQRKYFRFFSSLIVIIAYILSFVVDKFLPKWVMPFLLAIAIIVFLFAIFLCACVRIDRKIIQDELTLYHENKSIVLTRNVTAMAIFAGIIFTQFTRNDVLLSYEVLVCMLVAFYAVEDGYYLFLEKRGVKDANLQNES